MTLTANPPALSHRPRQRRIAVAALVLTLLAGVLAGVTPDAARAGTAPGAALDLVPWPASVTPLAGEAFELTRTARIIVPTGPEDPGVIAVADELAGLLRASTGYPLPVLKRAVADPGDVRISFGGDASLGAEGYELDVTAGGVRLRATAAPGLFYGMQTLRQLLPVWVDSPTPQPGPWIAPAVRIRDTPRYAYRGVMLDIARHFQPPSVVKRLIDDAAAYKVNHLHLHVADDQGFRIAIEGRPELTEIGGQYSINNDPGGWWTQDEYRDVVAYAASRHMTVIPEVDTPGHTNAIVMSYPNLPDINCTNRTPPVWNLTGAVGYSALCPESENTWAIVTDIVEQLSAMTPGPYYHVGGDEVPTALLSPSRFIGFMDREAQIVKGMGKTVIGWAELSIANFDDPDAPPAVAQFWNNGNPTGAAGDTARRAVMKGMKVIMSPANHTYLDMKQISSSPLGLTWAGTLTVNHFYNWSGSSSDPGSYIPARTASLASTTLNVANTTLSLPATAGDANVKVPVVTNLAVGRTVNVGSGDARESRTIAAVGTQSRATTLAAPAEAGATNVRVASVTGFTAGERMDVGSGDAKQTVTVTAVGTAGAGGTGVTFTPALDAEHASGAAVLFYGTGITLAAPLDNAHAQGTPVDTNPQGSTNIRVASVANFEPGDTINIGPAGNQEQAVIVTVGTQGAAGTGLTLAAPVAGSYLTNVPVATPVQTLPAVTDEHILGVESPLWSETLQTIDDIEFMAFPRLPATAELGWSQAVDPERNLASFVRRLAPHGPRWMLRDQNFYPQTQVPWRIDVAAPDVVSFGATVEDLAITIAAPGATTAQVSATVDWGDGTNSPATVTGREATNKTSNGRYTASASHTYAQQGWYDAAVTVTGPSGSVTAPFRVRALAPTFANLHDQLDALAADGGITDSLEAKIRHALDTAEQWLANPRKLGPALSHLDRAVGLLEWQADVVESGKLNQGDPAGLRALADAIRVLEQSLRP